MDAGAQYLERGSEIFTTPVFGARGGALATAAGTRLSVVERPSPRPVEPLDLIASTSFEEMDVEFDPKDRALWCHFAYKGRPSFTPALVRDLHKAQNLVRNSYLVAPEDQAPIRYLIWASRMPGVWSLGGDLNLFASLIRNKDKDRLLDYALKVVEVVYKNCTSMDLPLITIALVQGDALGGGFEGVLSSNYIIAERSAKFGLPEVLFNLFPGMGAYSLLARRIAPALAERMIMSGRIYGAEELHQMGVVDMLVEDGEGEARVRKFISRSGGSHAMHQAVCRARHRVNPITHEELIDITRIWVDTAIALDESDLRKMLRLVSAQDRRCIRTAEQR